MAYDHKWMEYLSEILISRLNEALPQVIRNGDPIETYPGCVNLSFAFVEGESLLMALKDIALSSGSACTSASLEPSYVLRAIGADEDLAHSSIRYGVYSILTAWFWFMSIKFKRFQFFVCWGLDLVLAVLQPKKKLCIQRKSVSSTFNACAKCHRYGKWLKRASISNQFNGLNTEQLKILWLQRICFY